MAQNWLPGRLLLLFLPAAGTTAKSDRMKMTRIFLATCCLFTIQGNAQVVSETVDFDNWVSAADNDFENRFDIGTGLSQLQANGITGGCLQTPSTVNWGNDNAVYCSRFKGAIGDSYLTGICFKYDTLSLNNINFDRAASLWMKPGADPNHYLIASVLDTRRIQVVSYSATGMSVPMQLLHGHWYNLLLIANFTGGPVNDQIDINAQVNDLGLTGTDPPLPTGFTNVVLHDSILIADTAIEASITGSHWGGALYLDNFRFDGLKSFDNCISTRVIDKSIDNEIAFSISNSILTINAGTGLQAREIEIFDLRGQKLMSEVICSGISKYELSFLSDGLYFLSMTNDKRRDTQKFILIR